MLGSRNEQRTLERFIMLGAPNVALHAKDFDFQMEKPFRSIWHEMIQNQLKIDSVPDGRNV